MTPQIPMDVTLSVPVTFRRFGQSVFRVNMLEGTDDNGQRWRCFEPVFYNFKGVQKGDRYGYCKIGAHEVHS